MEFPLRSVMLANYIRIAQADVISAKAEINAI